MAAVVFVGDTVGAVVPPQADITGRTAMLNAASHAARDLSVLNLEINFCLL